MELRSYQQDIVDKCLANTAKNISSLIQLDTGAGKTAALASICKQVKMPIFVIAHRNFLVEQMSKTLTNFGVAHDVIGNSATRNRCMSYQRDNGILAQTNIVLTTIQTLSRRVTTNDVDFDAKTLLIIDEAHHAANNNWYIKLKTLFKDPIFIGATATPYRLDEYGLGIKEGGLFNELVQADELKEHSVLKLIAKGILSDYEVYSPPSHVNLNLLKRGGAGDFTYESMTACIEHQNICGDVLNTYKKLAKGLTIIYTVTISSADRLTKMFKDKCIVASYIASNLSSHEVIRRIDAFKRGDIQVLINVEMITEGFDLPEVTTVIMLRPTASFTLYKQMVGRALRYKKHNAIIIDHVGNVMRHGDPAENVIWSLDAAPKKDTKSKICHLPCPNCGRLYNIYKKECPNCGTGNVLFKRDCERSFEHFIKYSVIESSLVRRYRAALLERIKKEEQVKAEALKKEKLKTEIQPFRQRSTDDPVGKICTQIKEWFLDNIKNSSISIEDINKFTTSVKSELVNDFWIDNFTRKDLTTVNVKKCERVLKKWLKSNS